MTRRLALVAVTAVAFAFGWVPGTAHADPAGTIQLNESGPSAQPGDVAMLDWNDDTVLLRVEPRAVGGIQGLDPRYVTVTPSSGTVQLPSMSAHGLLQASLAGNLVTGVAADGLHYVNADGTGAGSRSLPDGFEPVTGSPDGYILVAHDAATDSFHLYDFTAATGSRTDLGALPGSDHLTRLSVVGRADTKGLVVTAPTGLLYMRFSSPGTFTKLDGGATCCPDPNLSFGFTLGANAVTWVAEDSSTGDQTLMRAPLTGAAATAYTLPSSRDALTYGVAALPGRTAWALREFDTGTTRLFTAPAAGGNATEWPTPLAEKDTYPSQVAATTTDFVVLTSTTDGGVDVEALPDASAAHGRTIAHLGASPITASAVAVGPGRAAWVDNSTTNLPVRTRELQGSGSGLTAGAATSVSAHSVVDYDRPPVTVSGRRTTYAGSGDGTQNANAWIADGEHAPQDLGPSVGGDAQVSGTRVLYAENHLRNLGTGATVALPAELTASAGLDYALWGNYVAYAEPGGSIWRKDLTGAGPDIRLSSGISSRLQAELDWIGVAGDFVAWHVTGCDSRQENCTSEFAYRNVATMTPAVRIDTPAGFGVSAIAMSASYLVFVESSVPDTHVNRVAAVDMTSGTSDTRTVSTASWSRYPLPTSIAASGSRVAWVSVDDGAARVADLPHVHEQPRFLGNPIAPASFGPRDGEWKAELVTSLAMPTCAVTIATGDTVVRSLDCANSDGDAQVTWDGTDPSGAVVPDGTYTWTLTGANADGVLLDYDGSTTPVTGTIRVGPVPPKSPPPTSPPPVTPPPVAPPPVGTPPGATEVEAITAIHRSPQGELPATGPSELGWVAGWGLLLVAAGAVALLGSACLRPRLAFSGAQARGSATATAFARLLPARIWRASAPRTSLGIATRAPPHRAAGPPRKPRSWPDRC